MPSFPSQRLINLLKRGGWRLTSSNAASAHFAAVSPSCTNFTVHKHGMPKDNVIELARTFGLQVVRTTAHLFFEDSLGRPLAVPLNSSAGHSVVPLPPLLAAFEHWNQGSGAPLDPADPHDE